jgi:hypothetical protein
MHFFCWLSQFSSFYIFDCNQSGQICVLCGWVWFGLREVRGVAIFRWILGVSGKFLESFWVSWEFPQLPRTNFFDSSKEVQFFPAPPIKSNFLSQETVGVAGIFKIPKNFKENATFLVHF